MSRLSCWKILALLVGASIVGCGLFEKKKPDQKPGPPQGNQPAPAAPGSQDGNQDWGAKIGAVTITPQADQIGAASIDTLALGGPDVSPKLAAFLEDPSPTVRKRAIEVLSKFGKGAEPAVPKLLEILRNVDPNLRTDAARMLCLIGSKTAKGGLKNALKDKSPAVIAWAHAGLSRIAGDCESRLEEVALILQRGSGEVAREAADALGLMNCPTPDVVGILIAATQKEAPVRAAAFRAIGHFGLKAAEAIPSLIGALKDKAWQVRQAALLALAQMGARAAPAIPLLTEILEDPAPRFRELAARALEGIGPPANSAVGALKKATLDQEPSVQVAAKRALASIQKEPVRAPAEQPHDAKPVPEAAKPPSPP